MKIKKQIKSPLRADIAGGFLDIWPISVMVPETHVINFSIPLWTNIEWEFLPRSAKHKIHINIQSPGVSFSKKFNNIKNFLASNKQEVSLLKIFWKHWHNQTFAHKNIAIHLKSEAPIGSGLGGSSSLCASLLKMFLHCSKQSMKKTDQLLTCRDSEAFVLKAPAGTQDYIPALYSNSRVLYIISYAKPGIITWQRKNLPKQFFEDHILLVYTGVPHHSGKSNWRTYQRAVKGDAALLKALVKLRDNALRAKDICEKEDWPALATILKKEYLLRKTLFSGWLPKKVASVCNLFIQEGAAVKLCGAGGGGTALLWMKNKVHKRRIQKLCLKHNLPTLFFNTF